MAVPASAAPSAPPLSPPFSGQQVHILRGNYLWQIARNLFGAGHAYSYIYNENRDQIRDPDLIYPGQIFAIPVSEPADRTP